MFSNPIYWEDSESNKKQFAKHVNKLGYNLSYGGRFTKFLLIMIRKKPLKNFLRYLM